MSGEITGTSKMTLRYIINVQKSISSQWQGTLKI